MVVKIILGHFSPAHLPTVPQPLFTNCLLKCLPNCLSPHKRGFFCLFQSCPRAEGTCAAIERQFCLAAFRCLSRPSGKRIGLEGGGGKRYRGEGGQNLFFVGGLPVRRCTPPLLFAPVFGVLSSLRTQVHKPLHQNPLSRHRAQTQIFVFADVCRLWLAPRK